MKKKIESSKTAPRSLLRTVCVLDEQIPDGLHLGHELGSRRLSDTLADDHLRERYRNPLPFLPLSYLLESVQQKILSLRVLGDLVENEWKVVLEVSDCESPERIRSCVFDVL